MPFSCSCEHGNEPSCHSAQDLRLSHVAFTTITSQEHTAFVSTVQNIGTHLPECTVSKQRRPQQKSSNFISDIILGRTSFPVFTHSLHNTDSHKYAPQFALVVLHYAKMKLSNVMRWTFDRSDKTTVLRY